MLRFTTEGSRKVISRVVSSSAFTPTVSHSASPSVEGFRAFDEPVDQERVICGGGGISGPFDAIFKILGGYHAGVALAVQYLDDLIIHFVILDPGNIIPECEGEGESIF